MFNFFSGPVTAPVSNPWLPFLFVVLGGLLTFGYQNYFRWRDRVRLDRERLRRLNMAFADLIQSVGVMHEEVVGQAKPDVSPDLVWHGVLARPDLETTPMSFAADDTLVLQGPDSTDVINDMRLLANRRNAACRALDKYNTLRTELGHALAPLLVDQDGARMFSPDQLRADARLRMMESDTNGLITDLIKMIREQDAHINALIDRYNAVVKRVSHGKAQGVGRVTTAT